MTSETHVRDSVNNEHFTEVPNLPTYSISNNTMNRNVYQVNDGRNQVNSNGNSTTQLHQTQEKRQLCNSRFIGVLFLLSLVLLSVGFLAFAIFFDEVFNDDNNDNDLNGKILINQTQNASDYEFWLKNNMTKDNIFNDENFISIIMNTNETQSSKPTISFDNFINGDFSPKTFRGKWISSNELLHHDFENNLCITNVSNNEKSIIISKENIQRYSLSGLLLSADRQYLMAVYNARKVFRYSKLAKYRIYSIADSKLLPPLFPAKSPRESYAQYTEWGPIGSQLVFVYRNNIYYKSDANSEPIQLTKSGIEFVLYNGIPDWVYEEEIICGPKTLWLSPDGNKLVYATIDDSRVDIMSWPHYGTYRESNGTFNQYTKIVSVRYPKPGRRNPTVSLNLISLSSLKRSNGKSGFEHNIENLLTKLMPPKDIEKRGDHYFTTFKWIDRDRFAVNWMTRAQNYSIMTVYTDINNWKPLTNFKLQSKNGWIDLFTPPLITPDNNSYIIKIPKMSSNKRDYFTHIAKISIKNSIPVYLTSGVFEVKELLAINPISGLLYFTATFPKKQGEKHLMSVSLNESETNSEPICHTCVGNSNDEQDLCLISEAKFSTNAEYYILQCQGPSLPRSEIYNTENHSLVLTLEENLSLKYDLQNMSLPRRIIMKVPIDDKYEIDVMLIVPESFDENSAKKYPLLFHVYGGPGSDSGSVSQSYLYNQFSAYMASDKKVIYALLDARGSPNHGCKFMYDIYRKIGSVEVEDTISVARYFRDEVPFVDRDKISIWGWSYGGYLTTMALENDYNDTVFKCGVAVAPVSDWMLYDSVYVERFMGFPTPEDNLENYIKSSTLDKVQHLNGKQFLIMFGTADDNVHSQNSMMLLKALNEANINYDTQLYPDSNHDLSYSIPHLYKKLTDFLDKCYDTNSHHLIHHK